jgi:hypothetical protein
MSGLRPTVYGIRTALKTKDLRMKYIAGADFSERPARAKARFCGNKSRLSSADALQQRF